MRDDVEGVRVVVMGLGLFGGGEAVARHLAQRGARVVATDLRDESELAESLKRLDPLIRAGKIETRLGHHNIEDFTRAEIVIVNPGVPYPWRNEYLQAARSAGARLLTEMRLAIGDTPATQVIGITGSQGKSTTAAMVHHILAALRPDLEPQLGGNIGGSLLDSPPAKNATLVLELSSFMLHWLATDASAESDRFTPGTAVITNLSPNHLDWHETFEHYAASKSAIHSSSIACKEPHLVVSDDQLIDAIDSALHLEIPGKHNRVNARLAVLTALQHLLVRGELDVATPELAAEFASCLRTFRGLPHRLHQLGVFSGIECINDSKSTTPESTLQAVGAFDDSHRIHLLAGGYDKGSDMSAIAELAPQLAGLYGIGATGPRITERGGILCETIDQAVRSAASRVKQGDVVLLSPGCASWDQFANYEARGMEFEAAIRRAFCNDAS